jgi:hypothetical protein
MSEENVEIVRRLYPDRIDLVASFADPDAMAATRAAFEPWVHDDVETVADARYLMLQGVETGGEGRPIVYGIDGLINFWRDWLSAWDSWVVSPAEFIGVDADRVLVLLDVQATSKTHGVGVPQEAANLLTLRDGKLARLELFLRRAEALEAVGLSE